MSPKLSDGLSSKMKKKKKKTEKKGDSAGHTKPLKVSNKPSSKKKKMGEKGDSTGHTKPLKLSNRLSSKKKKKVEEKGDSTGHTKPLKVSNRPSIKKKKMEEKGDSTGHTKLSNKMKIKKKKKKKPQGDNGRAEVEFKLGLGTYWTLPLESATMLDISTWSLENQAPLIPEYLPHAFLRRLWLLSPEARSPCCQPPDSPADTPGEEMDYEQGQDSRCAVNPLDLVTAVYMSANSFLQQEMTLRMVQCQFAVPLVLPAIIPEQSCFLLWPLRGVVSQWRPHSLAKTKRVLEADLASTEMPMVSCVKLGHCGVSKSRVLSHVIGGPGSHNASFLHRGMDGGQLHRKLSNGLVELGWSLPSGDPDRDIFTVPVVISNLRGDAAAHERCLNLLCRASSAVVVFCGVLREKEKLLLASWKGMASKLILIDLSDPVGEENTRRDVRFVPQNLGEEIGLPNGAVLSGGAVSEEELADKLRKTLNDLLPDRLRYVTLEAAADIAVEVGMCRDEGAVCRKAMAAAEEVLKGLEHGSAQFREKQLPLQGPLWSRLAELDKEESRQIRSGEGVKMETRLEKRRIIHEQSSYRMTTSMKVFIDALFTTDKMERTFFLNWMKLRLRARQMRQCTLQKPTPDQQEESVGLNQETGELTNGIDDGPEDVANGANYDPDDDDSFCTDSTVEGEEWTFETQLDMHYGENNGLRHGFSEQEPEQELNLGPVVELHMAGDPTDNYGLELSCPEERSEKVKLDSVHMDVRQMEFDPSDTADKIMEEGSREREANENGTQSLNKDDIEKINDEWESSYSEGQNKKQEQEPNISPAEQVEKRQLDPIHADAEQVDVELDESAEQIMEPSVEEEVTGPSPEPLNMDYTENSRLHFDISEQQSEQELHVAGDPGNDGLESNYSEEQTEKQELETNMDQTDQTEKEQLDPVLSDAEQVDLDLEESTEQSLEEGTTEKAAIENETLTLYMDYTENSGLIFDLPEQHSERGLSPEPAMALHMAGDPTVNDEQESSYYEEQTEKKRMETNLDQTEQIEKGQLDSVRADEEQESLGVGDSTEQIMEPGIAEEEVTEAGPEPVNIEVTENSGLYIDVFEQQSEKGLQVEPVEELHVTMYPTVKDDLESKCTEEQTENLELDPNMDQIDQTEKEQVDSVPADTEREDLDLEESTKQNMEEGTIEKAAIENETQTLNMDYTESIGLHFDLPEQQSERGLSPEPAMELHMAGDPTVNDEQDSSYSEEQTEKKKVETNLDQTERIEKGVLDSVHVDGEQVDLDFGEYTEQDIEPRVAEEEVIEPGPEPLNMEVTENSGLHFDNSEQQSDPIHPDAELVDLALKKSAEQNMVPGLTEEEVIEPGPEPLNMEVSENSVRLVDILEQQSDQGLKVEPVVELHVTMDPTVKDDLESKCTEEQTEKQQLDPNMDQIDHNEKEPFDPVLADAEQVDLALEESAEKDTEPGLAENDNVEPQPFHVDHTENSGLHFALTEQQSEQGLNLDPVEEMHIAGNSTLNNYGQELNRGSEQKCEQTLNLETGLELRVAEDLTKNDGLETSYPEEQTENLELDPNMNQIDQTEKEQLDSVHADTEREDLDLEESTEQNMEEGTTEKAAIENKTQTLNMDYTENIGLHFDIPEQRGLSPEPAMELHMAGDPTINDEQESSYSEEQTEKKRLETNLDQTEQIEKGQLDSVHADEEQVSLDFWESAEQDTELELTEKEIIEPGPQLMNTDHTENSGLHFALFEQQSEQGLNLDPVEDMHIAGNATLNAYGQELNSSEKRTKTQELESNLDKIDQSEKRQLDSVLTDGEQVDLNLSNEEYAEQNMEKGSDEKEATENETQLDPVIESVQLDSFHTDEENEALDIGESAEQIMEPWLAEKDAIKPGPEPLNMGVTENNGLHFDLSKQQSEQWLKQEPIEEMRNAGSLTLNDCGQELNSSEKQIEKQELESDMDQIEQSEIEHLDPVLPDAGQEDLDLCDETYAEQNMPEKDTFEFGLHETLNEEQNLELTNPENELTDMNPGSKNEFKPALEEQMDLEPTMMENMGLEPIKIVQHAEIDQSENRDSLEEQAIILEISEKQSLHEDLGATQTFDLNPPEEQFEEQIFKPYKPHPSLTAANHVILNASLENQEELDTFVEHYSEADPSSLGLEHFLREMGLIFELTHMSLGSGSHNVLRLPGLAVDLLLYGIPLELMDGDASNIPCSWLGHVLAELKRRLPPIGIKVRVLTNLGVHCARNAEVFSALFGVDFPRGRRKLTRGVYMLPLWLPDELRMDMDCDLLIMVDVEGLCSPGLDQKGDTLVHDNEMATIATGLSDVLMHNITSYGCAEFESSLTVMVNALLRTEVCGYTPICKLLTQDKGLSAKMQAFQLGCVAEILQADIEETGDTEKPLVMAKSSIPCLIGPWQNTSFSEPIDKEYSKTVIELKQNLFEALTKCASKSEATGLPEFMGRLFAVWEAVKAESFSIGLQNTEVAKAFSMLCTELSHWEMMLLEHMESWFVEATKRVIFNNARALKTGVTGDLLSVLKQEARVEVKTEVDEIRSNLETYLIKDDLHKTYIATYRPTIMSNMNKLQDQVTEEMIQKLETVREDQNSSMRLKSFQSALEKGQEAKLHTLTKNSKLTNISLEDMQLEEEFEGVWNNALSNFDFRLAKIDDIPGRVTEILRENLISRGLQKHMKKLKDIGKNNTSGFIVHDEHFKFHCRMKHIRRQRWLQAHYVVNYIIEEYNQFVVEKSSLVADVSDSYITEVLENVEEILTENPLENTSAFEVDLKVYLCGFVCKDFQEIHEHYTKDSLLAHINGAKNSYLGGFIYQVRKRDQCQRVARSFTSMVFKPTALDYIYRPLGRRIVEEMVFRDDAQQYLSPQAFNRSLLEELMEEDSFESFLEYLLSYESFSLGRIQKWVVAHLSETTILEEWTKQRLEEIVKKMNAAVRQTEEDVCGVLSDTKVLLEKVCLNLERDGDVSVSRDCLDGPLFSITTEWSCFVTCLLEALDEMQLTLAQEFSHNVDITQLLQALPIRPQDCLLNRVRGCDKRCPFCGAPCEVGEEDHEVHRALLHRPKGMLSYTCHDSSSLSHNTCPFDIAQDNLFLNRDTEGQSLAYRDYLSLYPDWSISPEDSHRPNAYWRYVLVRFNGRFAGEYNCEPALLPEDWETITQEEALESLNQAFHTDHC